MTIVQSVLIYGKVALDLVNMTVKIYFNHSRVYFTGNEYLFLRAVITLFN